MIMNFNKNITEILEKLEYEFRSEIAWMGGSRNEKMKLYFRGIEQCIKVLNEFKNKNEIYVKELDISLKQSSVEWLFDQLVSRTDKSFFLQELNEAKEMHKQEIIDANLFGQREDIKYIEEAKQEAVNYYSEKYK